MSLTDERILQLADEFVNSPDRSEPKIVAWEVDLNDGWMSIVFATTASKARWIAVRSWRSAGYGQRGQWPYALKAKRVPHLDNRRPSSDSPPRAWNESYL